MRCSTISMSDMAATAADGREVERVAGVRLDETDKIPDTAFLLNVIESGMQVYHFALFFLECHAALAASDEIVSWPQGLGGNPVRGVCHGWCHHKFGYAFSFVFCRQVVLSRAAFFVSVMPILQAAWRNFL